MEYSDLVYWLWLANGLGPCCAWMPLWDYYADIHAIWQDRYSLYDRRLVSVRQMERLLTTGLDAMEARAREHAAQDIHILTWDDDAYPGQLRDIDKPPVVLYVKGDVRCLQNQLLLGIVGTRHPSAYGVEATRQIGDGLAAAGAVLVSGLAEGLDSEAHKAALRQSAQTVGVLGTGIDRVFPARNRQLQDMVSKCGALVSEYPCGQDIRFKETFVQRNRIIAGLTQGLCVAEARLRSGTMSTVRYAVEYGRQVYAVPGSIFSELSEGTNLLLKEGAKPVTSAADILEEYGLHTPLAAPEKKTPASADGLEGDLRTVYDALQGTEPRDAVALTEATGLAAGRLMAALTRLEMRGLVRQRPGRRFERAL